jgi:hypothetical protein
MRLMEHLEFLSKIGRAAGAKSQGCLNDAAEVL